MLKTNSLNHRVTFGNTTTISMSTPQFLPQFIRLIPRLLTTSLFTRCLSFASDFKILNASSVSTEVSTNSYSLTTHGISARLLFQCRFTLFYFIFFKKCMHEGVLPSAFKITSVTTIFKSGDSSSVVCNQLQTYFYITSHC